MVDALHYRYDTIKDSFRLYTGFVSASIIHLEWIKSGIERLYRIQGVIESSRKSAFQLKFSKKASVRLLKILYYRDNIPYLHRKRSKIIAALDIISKQAGMGKLVNPLP